MIGDCCGEADSIILQAMFRRPRWLQGPLSTGEIFFGGPGTYLIYVHLIDSEREHRQLGLGLHEAALVMILILRSYVQIMKG